MSIGATHKSSYRSLWGFTDEDRSRNMHTDFPIKNQRT